MCGFTATLTQAAAFSPVAAENVPFAVRVELDTVLTEFPAGDGTVRPVADHSLTSAL